MPSLCFLTGESQRQLLHPGMVVANDNVTPEEARFRSYYVLTLRTQTCSIAEIV